MIPSTLLIANRGEIAIRVIRAAAELGIRTVAVHSADDADSLHTRKADVVRPLEGRGVRAYLDSAQLLAAAAEVGADAIHPGYGFLSENASFAKTCAAAGVRFVGPRPEVLELFGDKVAARRAAQEAGVPTLAGSAEPVSLAEARRFFGAQPGGIVLKAVAGGGGRGMRVVRRADELDDAYARCISEAAAAFGDGAVYAEALMAPARHVEIQVLGDGAGAVAHLGERDCSVQRRHQKLIEVAPSPGLPAALRERIIDAALALARAVRYDNIGTFEFLVDAGELSEGSAFAFIEANPRLQVEHTVTEEVTGVDLVETQLRLAGGASLAELGFVDGGGVEPKGCAIQVRINMETMDADGATVPTGGTIGVYELPSGKGIRVDGFGYAGYRTSPSFDSLLAKLIVHRPSGGFAETAAKAYQALRECRIEGVETNLGLLADLVSLPDFAAGRITTGFIEEHLGELGRSEHERRFHAPPADGAATPAGGAPG
ncbi:MAG: biotin carboxylase N-terminal domain-containing protein, partial [Acidimicrobiales bacterium]